MVKKLIFSGLILTSLSTVAQESSTADAASFELGSGLNFQFNESAYQFKLGGMVQPYIAFDKVEDADAEYFLNSKRTYFNFSGKALKEKVSFFIQTDFSLSSPLLDAWIAFHPTQSLNITFGQKQTIANNREMMIMETMLQFPDRSLLSTEFSNTGREFGLFIEQALSINEFTFIPQVAVTSGDGRNSFGADSRDFDLGGLKYAARLDVYPLGMFSEGNSSMIADLAHETKPKVLIGAAASFNDGASNSIGEGHGDFLLYNALGRNQLPDYRQLYSDILVKYKGFSILGEYVISTATNLNGTFTDVSAVSELATSQISEYLALGSSFNVQVGYVTKSGYAADFRYSAVSPEFERNVNSQIRDLSAMTLGLTRYIKDNDLKIQTAFSSITDNSGLQAVTTFRGELIVQLIF